LEDELERRIAHEEKEMMRKRAQRQAHEEEEMMRKRAIKDELERRKRAVQDEEREREEQWLRMKMYIQQQHYQQPKKDREEAPMRQQMHSLQAQTQFSPPLLQRQPLQPEQLNPTATGWQPQTTADTTQSSTRSTTPVQSAMPAIQLTAELNQSDSTTQQLLQMLQQQMSLNQQQQQQPGRGTPCSIVSTYGLPDWKTMVALPRAMACQLLTKNPPQWTDLGSSITFTWILDDPMSQCQLSAIGSEDSNVCSTSPLPPREHSLQGEWPQQP
jgi:hypothetical protein